MSLPRVVLADDHVPIRAGIRAALAASGFDVVAEAGTGPDAVAAVERHRPDVCVLDVNMPGGGIEAARRISSEVPETQIVMLSVSESHDDFVQAIRAGAAGYLLKHTNPDRLGDALRGVLAGEAAIPRTLVAHLVREFRHTTRERTGPLRRRRGSDLSERQWQVIDLMREGRTTKEIALALGLSAVTVRRHISELLARMGAPDRETALRMVDEAADG